MISMSKCSLCFGVIFIHIGIFDFKISYRLPFPFTRCDTEKLVGFLFFIFLHRFFNSMCICLFISFLFIVYLFYLSFTFTRRIHTIEQQNKNLNRKMHMKPNSLNTIVNEAKHTTVVFYLIQNCICWDMVKIEQRANDTTTRRVHVFFLNNTKRMNAIGRYSSLQDEKGQVHLLYPLRS